MNKLVNFRDLGGVAAEGGRKVKKGLLFRSAQLHRLLEEEHERLADCGLGVIVDFRNKSRIEEYPNDDISGAEYVNIDVMRDVMKNFRPREEWIRTINVTGVDVEMTQIYRDFIGDEYATQGFRNFLLTLAKAKGPVLFHCYHGKDRTGFAAALILRILGVGMADIMFDFLLTTKEREEANRQAMERYAEQGLSKTQLAGLEAAYNIKQEYLETTFEAIDKEFGSFENYVEQGLGIGSDVILRLKELYLE